jgi:hypothetical protein
LHRYQTMGAVARSAARGPICRAALRSSLDRTTRGCSFCQGPGETNLLVPDPAARASQRAALAPCVMNDDESPLTDLMSCITCSQIMKLEKSTPDGAGGDFIQYRCETCGRSRC